MQLYGRVIWTWGTALLLTLSVLVWRTPITVFTKVFLFLEDFPIHKSHIGSQKEGASSLLSPFRELGQDYFSVSDVWRLTLICQKIQNFPPCKLPGCSNLVATPEDVLYVLDKVFYPACWVGTQIISCSALLE